MAASAIKSNATYIGTAAEKAAMLGGAAVGDFYFEDDTGLVYRKSNDGLSWALQATSAAVAHDAPDSGNPTKIGGRAESTEFSAVADGDRVDAFFDLKGRLVTRQKSRTSATTQVADNAANVTLLALNETRLGAVITNDSSARLYVKLGATATTTDYTVSLSQHETYEVPFGYTGIIDGIWASDPNDGAARVTELT